MNRNIHPLAAFLVVLISITVIATWYWCDGEAKAHGGPAGLSVDPDGHLYVQVGNKLLEHDVDGRFLREHDLSALGVEVLLGGTAFFSNGDILLRRGPDTRTFLDTIRAYQRKTNRKSLVPDAPDAGMVRCDLDAAECRVFGEQSIDFKSAFSVYIDWQTDDVYISDSSRHVLRKYTGDGTEAAGPAEGFRFPNQLMRVGEHLMVADTNHHRVQLLQPGSDGFGDVVDSMNVVPRVAARNGERWPSHFARVGENWWVNNMKTGMNYGGIYVFDDEWRYERRLDLPIDSDPIAIILFDEQVLISDWYGNRVHRLSTTGENLGDFGSTGLDTLLAESAADRRRYRMLAWFAVVAGFALAVIVVIKGLK